MGESVLGHLLRINRMRIRNLRRHLTPCGYTGVMHLVLLYADSHPGASQDEIAAYYALDKTSVARDARKLEDLGHLTRMPNPENRRQNRLDLTQQGREMAGRLQEIQEAYDRELAAGISDSDWAELKRLLALAEENACRSSAD